uniref:MARVEL domain-containing protein n=1 Tax=Anopheles melas TaxID=34690 RepID=A0A182TYP1_9DIPT
MGNSKISRDQKKEESSPTVEVEGVVPAEPVPAQKPSQNEISRITMANAESGADQADRGMRKEYFNSSGAGKFLPPVLKLLELSTTVNSVADGGLAEAPTTTRIPSLRLYPMEVRDCTSAVAIVCIGLIDDPAHHSRLRVFISSRTVALAYGTFVLFLVFSVVYLFGKVIRDNFPWKLSSLLNLTGFILYLATAACILNDWSETKNRNYWPPNTQRMDFLCGAGSVAVVGALFYLIDLIVTVRLGMKGEIE